MSADFSRFVSRSFSEMSAGPTFHCCWGLGYKYRLHEPAGGGIRIGLSLKYLGGPTVCRPRPGRTPLCEATVGEVSR